MFYNRYSSTGTRLAMALAAILCVHCISQSALASSDVTPTATITPAPVELKTPVPVSLANDPESPLTIVLVGDVMPGRMVNSLSLEKNDFTWPYSETAELLRNADLTLGNLEAPLPVHCPTATGGFYLCADQRAIEGIVGAGFDGMSVANNHALDYGLDGYQDTVTLLETHGIAAIDHSNTFHTTIKGWRISVMGLLDVDRRMELEATAAEIRQEAAHSDLVIGLMHWGYEYQPNESPRQKVFGYAFIKAGMNILAGSHTHVLQPIEPLSKGIIFYSMGNFVFDQNWSDATQRSALIQLSITHDPNGEPVIAYTTVPILIQDSGQPQVGSVVVFPTVHP
jgi:poly-gamma-glutamate synthesis protein (capsule biosynthesis protein)